MGQNRGKDFEQVIRECFERVPGVSIDRLHDQMNGYAGSSNIADFIVYRYPNQFYFECKSVHGGTLSINSNDPKKKYGLITNKQWEGLLQKSEIPGVYAGIICWWIDYGVTRFIPIQVLHDEKVQGKKSIRYDTNTGYDVPGHVKRVFWDYDMNSFLNQFKEV